MLFDDHYKTISKTSEGIYREKGSKFIAYAFPVRQEEGVRQHLADIKSEHPKARHYCYALRLSPDKSVYRVNDDGEPSGTAGKPILNVLLSRELTNILVVVVRYFGGTLLGVPGLINAYKTATIEALQAAQTIELIINDIYNISFHYLQTNDIMKVIKEHDLRIIKQNFENKCDIEIEVPKAKLNTVLSKIENSANITLTYLRTQ